MPARVRCPGCQVDVNVPDSALGKNVRCSKCNHVFQAVAPSPPPEVVPVLELADEAAIQEQLKVVIPVAEKPAPAAAPPSIRPRRSAMPWVLGGLAVVGVFLFLCVGVTTVAAIWVLGSRRPQPVAQTPPPNFPPAPKQDPWPKADPLPKAEPFPRADPFPIDPVDPRRDPPAVVPPAPIADPEREGPPLPRFEVAENSYKPGTQTRLKPLRTVPAPGNAVQLAYSPKHQLVFMRNSESGVWVVDVKDNKSLGIHSAETKFSDMSLAPDESSLYVADYGGTNIGYGTPRQPSYVHRYDLAKRTWEKRKAPKVAFRIETVDAGRFLLLEQDQWVAASLNRWEAGEPTVTELARIRSDYFGDFDYDPRTGRVYHGNSGSSSRQISVYRVAHDRLINIGNTGTYGTAQKGGGSATLSIDGSRFYYGALQVEALDVKRNINTMAEVILAASRDLAFGEKNYYKADTGERAGTLGFDTKAYALTRDSQVLWAYNAKGNSLHEYAIEGDK
jgi:predicted Zn finger-like uncharacterized protein